jgi:hypothetical protein
VAGGFDNPAQECSHCWHKIKLLQPKCIKRRVVPGDSLPSSRDFYGILTFALYHGRTDPPARQSAAGVANFRWITAANGTFLDR